MTKHDAVFFIFTILSWGLADKGQAVAAVIALSVVAMAWMLKPPTTPPKDLE